MTLRERWGVGGLVLIGAGALLASFVLKPFVPPAMATDTDSDGLSDSFENAYGTLANDADTDNDGLNDWDEIFVHGTDPMDGDTDGDAVKDDVDEDPLGTDQYADGGASPSGTYSANLSRQAIPYTSVTEGLGVLVHSGEEVFTLDFMSIDPGYGPPIVLTGTYRSGISWDGRCGKNWTFSWNERVQTDPLTGDTVFFPGTELGFQELFPGVSSWLDYGEVPPDRRVDPPPPDTGGGDPPPPPRDPEDPPPVERVPVASSGHPTRVRVRTPRCNRGERRASIAGTALQYVKPEEAGTDFEYIGPADSVRFTMTRTSSDIVVRDINGFVRTFAANSGRKVSESDRFGNAVTYSYDTSGKLTTITDAVGHYVSLTYYAGTGRVSGFMDSSGRAVQFVYNVNGQLAKVIGPASAEFPGGRVWQFRYSTGSTASQLNDNMTRAIDPKGQTWLRSEFDENDRVVKQYVGPDYFTFTYSSGVTTVLDREGNQRDWALSGALPTSLKEYSNRDVRSTDPAYWITTIGHNSSSLRTKIVYPRGNRVDFDFDSKGNVTEVRRKATDTDTDNNSNDIYENYSYDTSHYNLLTAKTDERGNTTTYTLEDSGSLAYKVVETITHPTVTYLDPDQSATKSFTWNSQGQMLTHTDGEGKVIEYQYVGGSGVKKGYLEHVIVDPGSGHLALTTTYSVNDWGYRTSITNPRSVTTTYAVNEYGWTTAVETTSPQSYEMVFSYDANGNVTQVDIENVDKNNDRNTSNPWWTTNYEYDILDNLVCKREEFEYPTLGREWYYTYTKNDVLKNIMMPEGNHVHFVYDERDLLYERTRGYSSGVASTDTSNYDGNRNLVEWKNGRNKAWTHVYDEFGRRTKTTNPLGHYTEWIYDKASNLTEVKRYEEAGATDVLMEHTKQSFDERNRMYKVERGLKGTSTWSFLATILTYDKRSLVTVVKDPRNKETSFTYDSAGRRTVVEDALGNTRGATYDANGNPVSIEVTDVTGYSVAKTFVTESDYDELDRLVEIRVINETSSSDSHTTLFSHDSLGVMVEMIDPEGNTTTWTHDGLGRVLEESIDLGSGASKKRTWAYDLNNRLTSHKDDANNETTWTYNARDLCIAETYADTGVKDFEYDLADNLTQWIDPNGTQVDLTYDDNDRNTARDITLGSGVGGTTDEDMTYDALDRLTEAKDNDVTVQFTWDSLSRKKTEVSGPNPISSNGRTTAYTYDDTGNVTQIDYPDGSFSAKRTVDDVNRTTLVEDGSYVDIVAVDYYGPGGRLKKMTFGNTTTAEYGYDGFRWVSDIDHKTSGGTLRAGYDIARDKVGNIVYEEWGHDSGKGHNYSYDKAYRLKKSLQVCNDPSAEHASPGAQSYTTKIEYNLSDDSDRTSVVTTPYGSSASTVSYTSNAVHEYTVVGGTNRSYDDNGNVVDDGTFTYTYDYRNQLLTVTRTSNSHVEGTYEYDVLGRRTRKTVYGGDSVRYYHDGLHEIEEFDGSTLLRKYVYRREIDSIVMMEAEDVADVDSDSNTSELVRIFYHYDARGNVARLTAAAQTVVESYESDPYGNVAIKDKNGSSTPTSQVGNPFVFQRRRHDDESGLMYFRARYYDAARGTWLQRDPLGVGPGGNVHEFESSHPVGNADPLGLDDKPLFTSNSGDYGAVSFDPAGATSEEASKQVGDILKKLGASSSFTKQVMATVLATTKATPGQTIDLQTATVGYTGLNSEVIRLYVFSGARFVHVETGAPGDNASLAGGDVNVYRHEVVHTGVIYASTDEAHVAYQQAVASGASHEDAVRAAETAMKEYTDNYNWVFHLFFKFTWQNSLFSESLKKIYDQFVDFMRDRQRRMGSSTPAPNQGGTPGGSAPAPGTPTGK